MSNKLWVCVPIASFALFGCATMQERQATGCTAGSCKVEITVTNCAINKPVPDRLYVPLPRGTKKIEWEIATNDYLFAANGIVITNPGTEFELPELSAGGKKFKWDNRHTKAGDYKYTINVVKTGDDPRSCPPLDPLISNQ